MTELQRFWLWMVGLVVLTLHVIVYLWSKTPVLGGIPIASPSGWTEPSLILPPTTAAHFDPYLHIPWGRYVGLQGRLHVVTACQDHRNHGPLENLPEDSIPWSFPRRPASDSIFQFHLAITRNVTYATPPDSFDRVELWVWTKPFVEDSAATSAEWAFLLLKHIASWGRKHSPRQCLADMPEGWELRIVWNVEFMDWVVRCLWEDFTELVSSAKFYGGDAMFVLYAAGDMAFLPLNAVLHYPQPAYPLDHVKLDTKQLRVYQYNGLPTAPWRKDERLAARLRIAQPYESRLRPRVVSWTMKKYSWSTDDELWVMWMLDVVGVDHIIIYIATTFISLDTVSDRLQKHPYVSTMVTLVALDIPTSPCNDTSVTWDFMSEAMVWDAFLRWQSHFDYAFIIDMDEFVQLFNPDPPYERVDVHSFIARNGQFMQANGQQASLERFQVRRTRDNNEEEPYLLAFLNTLITMTGYHMNTVLSHSSISSDDLPKSLFWIPGSVTPYLHNNRYAKDQRWDPAEAHILHIREDQGVSISKLLGRLSKPLDLHPLRRRPQRGMPKRPRV